MRFEIGHVLGGKSLALLVISCLAVVSSAFAGYQVPGDSIGTEVIDGKTFILYKVEPKETLYSISNRYNISVAELVSYNPETEAGLQLGTVLHVPLKTNSKKEDGFHLVEKSETLYSIGRKYNVSVAQLKEWNNFSTDALSLGDRLRVTVPESKSDANLQPNANRAAGSSATGGILTYAGKIVHTVEPKETLYSIARIHDTTEEKIREWNALNTNNLAIGQKIIVGTAQGIPAGRKGDRMARNQQDEARPKEHNYNSNPISITQIGDPTQEDLEGGVEVSAADVRKMTELGMAMSIEDTVNTKKYLALHRTAPIGTIMQVHNEMNNLSVFVRVVGKLPATGDNDKVLIKLSRKAFDKLGAYNEKFPVRLTYVP